MEVAMAESMQQFDKDQLEKERLIIQNTESQYDEDQLLQMALKESQVD